MGRYMMIMAGGLMGLFGIVLLTMQSRSQSGVLLNARSAGKVQASNIAHAATDLAIHKLELNKSWRTNGTPWQLSLDGGMAEVSIDSVGGATSSYVSDTVKVTVVGQYNGEQSKLITMTNANYNSIIPEIYSALSIYLKDFGFSGGGDFGINGNDESGVKAALPGIVVANDAGKQTIIDGSDESHISGAGGTGSSAIEVKDDLDFQSALDLNDELEASGKAQYISGNYKGILGTESNPGVFIVEQELKITGDTQGYGIMVIKNNGELDVGELETAGTFDFHGLIVFEDGYAFDGRGSSTIHGGIIIGGSKYYDFTDIDLRGTVDLKYNSESLKYAVAAAASAVSKVKFEKLSVYE